MKKFFEDSSQAKMFTPELSYRYNVRHIDKRTCPTEYELRDYSRPDRDHDYTLVDLFATKQAALVAKEFAVLQYGPHYAVVAVTPIFMRRKVNLSSTYGNTVNLSEEDLEYINRVFNESITNLVKGSGGD